jgi:hypothetical protein
VTRSVEEIQAELREAEAAAKAAAEAKRKAVTPVWEYTIRPSERALTQAFGEPYWDDTIVAYYLNGRVVNEEECKAAGWSDTMISTGGMDYLFNTGTGKLIGGTGGGRVYLSAPWGKNQKAAKAALAEAVREINAFLTAFPQGGDITDIIVRFRKVTRED